MMKLTFWILLLGVALRAFALLHTDPVTFDSAVYFEMAEHMRAGRWRESLAYPYPPVFPFLIAGIEELGVSAEIAGLLLSLISGLLVIFPLVMVTRAVVGEVAACGAAFLWAIHPYAVRLSVQALSDSPMTLFVALALWAGLKALERQRLGWALMAGIASGLGYLTRPEGIEPALVLAVLYILHEGGSQSPIRPLTTRVLRRIVWAAAPLVGWTIIASPYVAYISMESGSITLSKKKSPTVMLRSLTGNSLWENPPAQKAPPSETSPEHLTTTAPKPGKSAPSRPAEPVKPSSSWLRRVATNVYIFQQPLVNGVHPFVLIFALIGIWHIRSHTVADGSPVRVLLLGLLFLHFIVLLGLAAATGPAYLGGHHFFLLVLYALPFSGAGLSGSLGWIRQRLPVLPWVPALAAILMIASTVAKFAFRSPGRESVIRPAAAWIQEQAHGRPVVVTNVAKLTYHAGADRVPLRRNYDTMIKSARARKAQFIAFYVDPLDSFTSKLQARLDSVDLELAADFSEQSGKRVHRFLIYRLRQGYSADTFPR